MSVYIDDWYQRYGTMLMCHMVADTTDELLAMADRIGVDRKWIQKPGTSEEHFDVGKTARTKAVRAGAIEVRPRQIVLLQKHKRGEHPTPKHGCPRCDGPLKELLKERSA